MENLDLNFEKVIWPISHYLFIEKIGPFMDTAQVAWQELHKILPIVREQYKIDVCMSLYKIEPQMIYRAGVVLKEKPNSVPEGLRYELFSGGHYLKYTLHGSYSQLPEACELVFNDFASKKLIVRDGFYIENYANDPETTKEAELITEILFPV